MAVPRLSVIIPFYNETAFLKTALASVLSQGIAGVEVIVVNDDLRIIVTQTTNGSCSLAIEAPESYRIRRGELPSFSETIIHRTASALQVQE